jgi:hypothetical protein
VDAIILDQVGWRGRQSAMTVSASDIAILKSGEHPRRDSSLNGDLMISVEGVVFVIPNPYEPWDFRLPAFGSPMVMAGAGTSRLRHDSPYLPPVWVV